MREGKQPNTNLSTKYAHSPSEVNSGMENSKASNKDTGKTLNSHLLPKLKLRADANARENTDGLSVTHLIIPEIIRRAYFGFSVVQILDINEGDER